MPWITLAHAFELYPTLRNDLLRAYPDGIRSDTKLDRGPEISELVFKEAEVDLGDGVTAEFSLTLWYFKSKTSAPRVAEISFKCKVKDGYVPRGAAARARKLFVGMQEKLGDWVNFEEQSKTALALPPKA